MGLIRVDHPCRQWETFGTPGKRRRKTPRNVWQRKTESGRKKRIQPGEKLSKYVLNWNSTTCLYITQDRLQTWIMPVYQQFQLLYSTLHSAMSVLIITLCQVFGPAVSGLSGLRCFLGCFFQVLFFVRLQPWYRRLLRENASRQGVIADSVCEDVDLSWVDVALIRVIAASTWEDAAFSRDDVALLRAIVVLREQTVSSCSSHQLRSDAVKGRLSSYHFFAGLRQVAAILNESRLGLVDYSGTLQTKTNEHIVVVMMVEVTMVTMVTCIVFVDGCAAYFSEDGGVYPVLLVVISIWTGLAHIVTGFGGFW